MKIAILSDIHGNKIALDAVLDDIHKNKTDQIIVLGDLITDLPNETNDVLDIIKSLGNNVIKGNRELYLLNNQEPLEYDQYITTYLTKKYISEINKNYINTIPEQISLAFDTKFSLRCVHGSPFSISEYIDENDDKTVMHHLNSINENILLCGHTHKQWYKSFNNKIIINPGSVGLNFSGNKTAQYVLIKYESNKILVELKNIKYDFNHLKKIYDLNIPWIRLCIKGMEDGIIYTIKFLEEAKSRTPKWPIPNNIWNNLFEEWCKNKII